MDNTNSIPQVIDLPTGINYNTLYKHGIAILQQLTGDIWTDYNEHDPGVTILEQLCYALTDIGYRASYPIQDLLCNEKGNIDVEDNCFFTAANIFTINPLTPTDYSKLLIDHFENIKNAWFIKNTATGYYSVKIEVDDDVHLLKKEDIIACLLKYRNLCENFSDVTFLKPYHVAVSGKVYINDSADPEEVLANILLQIKHVLSPDIHLYQVSDFSDDTTGGYIFSGPKPANGIIQDKELYAKPEEINTNQLVSAIMSVTGVQSLQKFNMLVGADAKVASGTQKIDENAVACSNIDKTLQEIDLIVNNIKYKPNVNRVKGIYFEKKNSVKRYYNFYTSNTKLDIPIPNGTFRNINQYYSIQNQFPAIYGIGERGLLLSSGSTRLAQTKQLKAYLLFFEQILTNMLAQLANGRSQFSYKRVFKYYTGNLYNVPDIAPIIKPFTDKNNMVDFSQYSSYSKQWEAYKKNSKNDFATAIDEMLNNDVANAIQEDIFLDHLLARFGENITPVTSAMLNSNSENYYEDDNKIKQNILKHYPKLSSQRGKAAVSKLEFSGLEKRLRTVLNARKHTEGGIKHLFRFFYDTISNMKDFNALLPHLSAMDGFHKIWMAGINQENYSISKTSASSNHELCLTFNNSDQEDLVHVLYAESHGKAQDNRDKLINKIKEVDKKAENFYLVEHSQLFQYDDKVKRDDDFYNFRISFVFPSYTSRFKEEVFQNYINEQVSLLTPAHIQPDIIWLYDIGKMEYFEELYERALFPDEAHLPKKADKAKSLIAFLKSEKQGSD